MKKTSNFEYSRFVPRVFIGGTKGFLNVEYLLTYLSLTDTMSKRIYSFPAGISLFASLFTRAPCAIKGNGQRRPGFRKERIDGKNDKTEREKKSSKQ